jgi:HD superfamily phosphodiesterase
MGMNRLDQVRAAVDEILEKQTDRQLMRDGYVHLYGVSLCAADLAMRRGLDAQCAAIMGLLHDIAKYQTGVDRGHEKRSAEAADTLLKAMGAFNEDETTCITEAIVLHRQKRKVHGAYAELLKDADALHHYLYPPGDVSNKEKKRLTALSEEIGLPLTVPL